MKTVRQTNYITLVSLIGQFRKGYGKFITAFDYYLDYCENRKIYSIPDEFSKVVANGTDGELDKWLRINVENATSYYD